MRPVLPHAPPRQGFLPCSSPDSFPYVNSHLPAVSHIFPTFPFSAPPPNPPFWRYFRCRQILRRASRPLVKRGHVASAALLECTLVGSLSGSPLSGIDIEFGSRFPSLHDDHFPGPALPQLMPKGRFTPRSNTDPPSSTRGKKKRRLRLLKRDPRFQRCNLVPLCFFAPPVY